MNKSVDEPKLWQIWSEGYAATGESGTATRHGEALATTFEKACHELARRDVDFAAYFDPRRLTYWGCRLFAGEADARKSFG